MFIREYLEHLVTIGVPAEKIRTLRSSYLYDQLPVLYNLIETIIEAYIGNVDFVIYGGKQFRLDEFNIPGIFLNQLKFTNVYINADDLFDESVKSLFSLSRSSKEFSNDVGMHPIQFNKFMEELASYNSKLKAGTSKLSGLLVSSVTELGRVLTSDGDFKVSDSNLYVWIGLFDNFTIDTVLDKYCKKIPPMINVFGACYELDRIIE